MKTVSINWLAKELRHCSDSILLFDSHCSKEYKCGCIVSAVNGWDTLHSYMSPFLAAYTILIQYYQVKKSINFLGLWNHNFKAFLVNASVVKEQSSLRSFSSMITKGTGDTALKNVVLCRNLCIPIKLLKQQAQPRACHMRIKHKWGLMPNKGFWTWTMQ